MDNRDLDNLYRDKLGDFQDQPDPLLWDRISKSLDEKKKKSRIIPLWWRWGAAAAVLVGALFLFAPWEGGDDQLPAVTITPPADAPAQDRLQEAPGSRTAAGSGVVDGAAGSEPSTAVEATVDAANAYAQSGNAPAEGVSQENQLSGASDPAAGGLAANGNSAKLQETGKPIPADGVQAQQANASSPVKGQEPEKGPEAIAKSPESALAAVSGDGEDTEQGAQETGKISIFDAINESEDATAVARDEGGKWLVGPSVAPVYFSSFGNGSPIASDFVDNPKSGTVNMSYGLQVSYKLSKKLRLRSGVHRVDYGYNTENVGFTSSPTARPNSLIRTISYSEESRNLVVESMVGGQPPVEPIANDVSAPSPAREGQMAQEFGYLEVPLEMQFSLIDRKWGLDLIGGMSSLFLIDNAVNLESSGSVTEMGEATNLNSLNFSTNFGLGLFYRFNPSFELNLQPMFKYQLNTFSETSGNFRPYSIGIYSGLSFRF